jgi:hypothetical protein
MNAEETAATEMILLEAERQLDIYKAALERIRDCDWPVLIDSEKWMIQIAREALGE